MEPPVISTDHLAQPPPKFPDMDWPDEPTPEETRLVTGVYRLFQIARDHRRKILNRWQRNYRALFNRNLIPNRRPWDPVPDIPEILPIIRTQVGFIMDQRITHTVAPVAIPNSDMAQMMAKIADDLEAVLLATWQANNEEREWTACIFDGLIYGTGWMKTCWETELAGGLGDAISRRVHPIRFYPDPRATNETDGDFYIEYRCMSLQELDRRYPGSKRLFNGHSSIESGDEIPSYVDVGESTTGYLGSLFGNLATVSGGTVQTSPELPVVHVLECWIKEHRYRKVRDERTNTEVQISVPSWRIVVVAGNRVLLDEPVTNLWSNGQIPYARFAPLDMGEMWAPSMVELLIPSQESINRILTALQQNVELTGNPIWKEASVAGLSRTPIINRPGQRIPVAPQDQASGWVSPPRIDASMIELLRYHLARMEVISGVSAIQKGLVPGGRNAQGVIDAVSESAFVVIRQIQRNLEYSLRTAGVKKADLIIENYTQPRFIAIAGPGGQRSAYALQDRHFQIPTQFGHVPLKYQLFIDAGSRRHTARATMEDRAIQLGTLGLIPPSAVLEAIDWPNAREVGQKAEQLMMMGAQAAGQRRRARG